MNVTTAVDCLGKAEQLLTEAKSIMNNPDSGAEDREKVPQLIEEAKSLKAQAGMLQDIDAEGALLAAAKEAKDNQRVTPASGAFKDWGSFLQACWAAGTGRKYDDRLQMMEDKGDKDIYRSAKDMVESIGASGGFLVPVEQDTVVRSVVGEQSLVRPRATIVRMGRRQQNIPTVDQTGATAGIPHWFGGMYATWAEEAEEKSEQDAKFRQITLTAHKLIMYTRASDELVDDSAVSLSDFLTGPMGFAGAIQWAEDYAFFRGSGAGQPLGVLNAGATITIPRQSGGNIVYDDLINMLGSLLPSARGAWFANTAVLPELMAMNGPAGNPSYLWGSAKDGVPNSLLGMPIYFTEKLPALGTAGDILLADWMYYLIGDRQAITIESTKFDKWRWDQTSWRAVHRVDGQPWLSAPLTYQNGVNQASPFVILGDKTT